MDQLMQAYPEGMRQALNIENVGTPEGSLDSQVFSLAPLALAFFAILAGAGAIVVDAEERGSIEVLLGNPLRRWQLVVGNFLATALSLLGIVAVVGLSTRGTAVLFDVDLAPRTRAGAIPGVALFAPTWSTCSARSPTNSRICGRRRPCTTNGSAIKGVIDWGNFVGVTLVTLLFVLLAVIAFGRRDIYT